ncbi:MAG TPA: hypothetical protein O0X63_02915 [Methanocorpusculum sp.]|nr:hypothetical protein [Methanocorpusculum sp.]HJJ41102.1 hypothetical protein [Methanocorpusculum sp.]
MTEKEELVLDPDFTEEEHAEFERLEKENPYKEIEEEKIRVPKRPERINDTGNDRLFLLIFCLVMAVFLVIVVFTRF